MKRKYVFLFLLLMGILSLPPASYANKSGGFITQHSKTIFKDCENTDIYPKYLENSNDGSQIEVIKWPYTLDLIYDILLKFSEIEPYEKCKTNGTIKVCEMVGGHPKGKYILNCGNNNLDINGEEWFWNDVKLETPTYNSTTYEIENYAATYGNNSPAIAGDDNIINQNNIGISLPLQLVGGISIVAVIITIMKWWKRNKKTT